MTGSCWRLLAIFSLIFVASGFLVPACLFGQEAVADRLPASGPAVVRVVAPTLLPRYTPPVAPVWIPPPVAPRHYPVAPQLPVFSHLVQSAGIIFFGRVTSVGRGPSSSGEASSSTNITFQVEHATRGTSSGQSLTIHEWAGLWSRGERYRVGEHVLLFLYSPSKLGLTSPVAGALGRFAVDSQGGIMMSAQHALALATDPLLGGKSVVPYAVFTQAVRRASGEELGR
jgi:hypothetical protein